MAIGLGGSSYASDYSDTFAAIIQQRLQDGYGLGEPLASDQYMLSPPGGTLPFFRSKIYRGLPLPPLHAGASQINYQAPTEGDSKNLPYDEYWLGVQVTQAFVEDDGGGSLFQDYVQQLGSAFRALHRSLGAAVLNNITSTAAAYVLGDLVALASTAHTKVGGGTRSNRLTGDPPLHHDAVVDMYTLGLRWQNWRGDPDPRRFTKLIVPGAKAGKGVEIVYSTQTSNDNRNAVSPVNAWGVRLVVEPAMTQNGYWGMQSEDDHDMKMPFRVPPTALPVGFDASIGSVYTSMRCRVITHTNRPDGTYWSASAT